MNVLPCRTVAEALLFLDLSGWPREGRSHRLEQVGGAWISVWEAPGRALRFVAPDDPAAHGDALGGAEPSRLIDPGQFLAHAADLAASVPLDPEDVDPAWRPAGARRLALAARCVDEVLKFVPAGASRVPPEAFFADAGRALRDAEPGRFERDRLAAVAASYREAARRYEAAPEAAVRPVVRPPDWDGVEACEARRLLPLPDAPWVAYAFDAVPLRAYLTPAMRGKTGLSADDLHEAAVARVRRQAPPSRTMALGPSSAPIRVAVAEGESAAEQILDPGYLRALGHDLGARRLVVAIPYRGVLLAAAVEHVDAIVRLAASFFAEPRGEALTPQVFLADDGVLAGRARTAGRVQRGQQE